MTTLYRSRDSQGLTLLELMVALTVTGMVLAGAMAFLYQQGIAFQAGTSHMYLVQNHQYALNTVERQARLAGLGVRGQQPAVVYAGDAVIAFSANHVSNDPDDRGATFIDVDAPNDVARAVGRSFQIPESGFSYNARDLIPADGDWANANAETIILFFRPDPDREGEYALWRQVNDTDPEIVATRLLPIDEDTPFFRYVRETGDLDAPDGLEVVAPGRVPFTFETPEDANADPDSNPAPLVDRLRAIELNFRARTDGVQTSQPMDRVVSRYVRLPNVGHRRAPPVCGDAPNPPSNVAVDQDAAGGALVTWNPSPDEDATEDIERYKIRRVGPGPADVTLVTSQLAPLPEGSVIYEWTDPAFGDLDSGTYRWEVAAVDCTPRDSPFASSNPVTIAP